MKKIFTLVIATTLLVSNCTQAFAISNYVQTTTVNESYTASSPSGKFVNYSGTAPQVINVVAPNTAAPVYYDNYAYPAQTYATNYAVPVYDANVSYNNAEQNYQVSPTTLAMQEIDTPQTYSKTVTTTDSYVDTREKADKIIDRGFKVLGGLAIGAAAAGFLISSLSK